MSIGTFIPPASWILGIPAPEGPPVASDAGAGDITATATWVYTFLRQYTDGSFEESAPSPASNSLTLYAKQVSVMMPNGSITHADYGINKKRLYRDEGDGYFFVAEVDLTTVATTDALATADLGDALESTLYLPAPDGMQGLIAVPNGIMAGFQGKTLYLSEPYRPHAYPLLNQYTMNAEIVGLGNVGTTIVVITKGRPYIGRGVDPAAYSFKQQPGIFPCISKRSIASSDLGVFWSTPIGMAACDGVSVILATKEFLSKREWQEGFAPSTIHGVVHDQRYYGWYWDTINSEGRVSGGGFVLDRSEDAYLVTHGTYVHAAHVIPQSDTLWVVQMNPLADFANYVYLWDAMQASPYSFVWKSKVHITDGADNFAFVQIKAHYGDGLSDADLAALQEQIASIQDYNRSVGDPGGWIGMHEINACHEINGDCKLLDVPSADYVSRSVGFKYWGDGVLKMDKVIESPDPVPMPSGFLAEKHEYQISGSIQVDEVTLATSAEELASV